MKNTPPVMIKGSAIEGLRALPCRKRSASIATPRVKKIKANPNVDYILANEGEKIYEQKKKVGEKNIKIEKEGI